MRQRLFRVLSIPTLASFDAHTGSEGSDNLWCIRGRVSTLIVSLVAFTALAGAGSAIAESGSTQSSATPRALTKNQKIALIALDAHKAALARYANFLSSRPVAIQRVTNRIQCVIDRVVQGGSYFSTFDALPDLTKQQVFVPIQFEYWYGFMYKLLPPKKGKYSSRAIKGLFLDAANKARAMNPDLTGERIIRGLRAQANRIDMYRSFPDVQACAVFDNWASNGYDLDRLDPLINQYGVIVLKIQAVDASSRISAAIAAMKTVPDIGASEADGFSEELVNDAFYALAQPLIP